ncbi:MAG TPA: hypothetical protein VF335_09210 [Chitinivibrionales bacterium]
MKSLCALLALIVIAGCDIVGTVVDIAGSETTVHNMRLSGTGMLSIITGGATKAAPLESFESIVLFPEEAKMVGGEFCFMADVTMRDGTRYTARNKAHENTPLTFVAVNQTVTGSSHRGTFAAGLTGVTKISIIR